MQALDERMWISDALWADIRPAPARFRITISVVALVVTVGAYTLAQIGFFHPRVGAWYDEATPHGNRLTAVLTVSDSNQLPVRVTGFRTAQPGVHIASSRGSNFMPYVALNPAPDGARAEPFTLHQKYPETVTIAFVVDCERFRPPLRLDIGTRSLFGNQTSTVLLNELTDTGVRSVCPVR